MKPRTRTILLLWAWVVLVGWYVIGPPANTTTGAVYSVSTMEDPPWFFYFHPVTNGDSFPPPSYNAVDGQEE